MRIPTTIIALLFTACSGVEYSGQVHHCEGHDADGDGFTGSYYHPSDGSTDDCGELVVPDCDDNDPNVHPGADELCNDKDDDCDGRIDPDLDGDGYLGCEDCDDWDALVHPGAIETCNDRDDDCNGLVDDGLDQDGDGWRSCAGDCNDQDPAVFPGAPETCNGLDDDCDGLTLEGEQDQDGDNWLVCAGDCDDDDPSVHPGAEDLCNGIDDNCDGQVAELDTDADGDGHLGCEECDDTNRFVFPGAAELCNGVDDDCDGDVDEGHDLDGDGFTTCEGDCDDSEATIYPAAPELCDGLDDDCDGIIPQDEWDPDGDGSSACEGDCAPLDPDISPTATERCNGVDDDCDGLLPADEIDADADGGWACEECDDSDPYLNLLDLDRDGEDSCEGDCDDLDPSLNSLDADGDGVSLCDGDCDDDDPTVSPAQPELCNFIDDDCDGEVDEGFLDLDGDGAAECTEICNGLDDDSDGTVDEGYSDGATTATWVDGTLPGMGDGSWSSPFTTIQDAIDARSPVSPCAIMVAPGTYWETLSVDGGLIELESTDGPETTIVDAAGNRPALSIASSLTGSRVEGFTFTGAAGSGNGGGLLVEEGELEIRGNIIEGNTIDGAGAGIWCRDCSGTIAENEICDNSAIFSGFDYGYGGGIAIGYSGSTVVVEDNLIEGNLLTSTYGFGGGIGLWATDEVWLQGNTVVDNSSSYVGGGLSVRDGSKAYVENNVFSGNEAGHTGGASAVEFSGDDGAWLVNNTVVANRGGAAQVTIAWSHSRSYLANNIVVFGDDGAVASDGGTAPTIVYGDVYGNAGTAWVGLTDPSGTNGNISADPDFVDFSDDGDWTNDDLGLSTGSACIDAGHPNTAFDDVDGTTNDMGAEGGPGG